MEDSKIVYAFHPVTLVYVGPVELRIDRGDMDPMEPGRWLIPGTCLEAEPPEAPPGQYVLAEVPPGQPGQAGTWVLRDIPQPPAPPAPAPEPEPEPLTPEQLMQAMDDMLENMLDDIARSQGFRNMDRAVSYRGDPNPVTDAKAQALFLYRSAFWARCDEEKALILAGEAEIPTLEEAKAMLPVFTPPAPTPPPAEE
jgi:hypothetical protein